MRETQITQERNIRLLKIQTFSKVSMYFKRK